MRLFVALEIPQEVRNNLAAVEKEWRFNLQTQPVAAKMRWVCPEDLHVTLKFIGEVSNDKIDTIAVALRTVHTGDPLEINLRGLGCFSGRTGGVFWAAIDLCPALARFAADIDRCLGPLEIPPENREFRAHVTLARFKDHQLSPKISKLLSGNTGSGGLDTQRDFGSMRTGEFHLMESKTNSAGPVYTKLQSFHSTSAA
jgi:2'-5' RNA ligase